MVWGMWGVGSADKQRYPQHLYASLLIYEDTYIHAHRLAVMAQSFHTSVPTYKAKPYQKTSQTVKETKQLNGFRV